MSRIFVTGAGGYVGGRVVEVGAGTGEIHGQWRRRPPPSGAIGHRLDLDDRTALSQTLRMVRPDVVLHTAYDMAAGAEPNLRWSRNVFAAAADAGARVLFVSSDMVFDGERGWYREDDPPNATLAYGRWKAELEGEVLMNGGVVARTALVWGLNPLSDNAEKLVLEPLRRGGTPRLFEDEWRTPTEVHDLAEALLQSCAVAGPRILHLAGPERLSRLELGRMIARHFGFDPTLIPAARRAEVAPERPRDASLLVETTREVIDARFRGPSEILTG